MENQIKILAGVVIAILLAVAGTWYLWQGDRQAVLSTESQLRQEQLEALLAGNGIAFETDDLDRVTVAAKDVQLARALADQASLTLPERSGFELFEDEDYGATEFVQRINYQRALQAELERTIIRIAGVRNARVHILQPSRSTFFRRENNSRASVVLELERRTELSSVAPSVAEIMLGAIEGLELKDIRIISGQGGVMSASAADGGNGFVTGSVGKAEEQRLTDTIYAVLDPLFDREMVGVSVSVDMDRSSRNVRREGVPVTIELDTTSDDGDGVISRTDSGLVTEEVTVPPGSIERIGVGVMLPHPVSDQSLQEIELILRAGLGLSDERGDSLAVMAYLPAEVAATGSTDIVRSTDDRAGELFQFRGADTGVLTQGQWTGVLITMLLALFALLIVQRIGQRRRQSRIVHQVSSWVKEPAHE